MAYSGLPVWLQRPSGAAPQSRDVKRMLRRLDLRTVCEDARCPNIVECFSARTATFLILGGTCTRNCRFCAVRSGTPDSGGECFSEEAVRIRQAAEEMGLRYVAVTSVTRDDLPDGGAEAFCMAIRELKRLKPAPAVEVLIPDFNGNWNALDGVVAERPTVLNHNLETVARLYEKVRPQADYHRSLELLRRAHETAPELPLKTGVMLGMGEYQEELIELMHDARENGVTMFTAGQYLQPTREHLPVERYVPPEEFEELQDAARSIGFETVQMAPLVRSSYHAGSQTACEERV